MINALYGLGFVLLLSTVWTLMFGTVDTLPYGIDAPLLVFMEQVNIVINLIPPLETIWNIFLIAIIVKISLLALSLYMWVVQLIRG